MKKFKGEYKTLADKYERWEDELRVKIEQDVKEVIKRRALSLKMNITNTQWTLSADDLSWDEIKDKVRFNQFQDFIIHVADYHKVDLYFTIEGGRFRWLIEPL